jgi:hypothetical protein
LPANLPVIWTFINSYTLKKFITENMFGHFLLKIHIQLYGEGLNLIKQPDGLKESFMPSPSEPVSGQGESGHAPAACGQQDCASYLYGFLGTACCPQNFLSCQA